MLPLNLLKSSNDLKGLGMGSCCELIKSLNSFVTFNFPRSSRDLYFKHRNEMYQQLYLNLQKYVINLYKNNCPDGEFKNISLF